MSEVQLFSSAFHSETPSVHIRHLTEKPRELVYHLYKSGYSRTNFHAYRQYSELNGVCMIWGSYAVTTKKTAFGMWWHMVRCLTSQTTGEPDYTNTLISLHGIENCRFLLNRLTPAPSLARLEQASGTTTDYIIIIINSQIL